MQHGSTVATVDVRIRMRKIVFVVGFPLTDMSHDGVAPLGINCQVKRDDTVAAVYSM